MLKKITAMLLAAALLMVFAFSCAAEDAESETQTENEAAAEEKETPVWNNILLLGGDSHSESEYERSDCMMILSLNVAEARVKITSIMRDTWVHFPGMDKSHRINAATVYGGPELAMRTVNEYFGTDIKKYILINMTNLIDIVDLVGGVDITITEEERKQINNSTFGMEKRSDSAKLKQSGLVHLDGAMAMAYSRIRKIDTDFQRVERQQNVLMGLAAALRTMNTIDMVETITELMTYVETNLNLLELIQIGALGMGLDMESIERGRIPAEGTYESGFYNGTYKIIPDFDENAYLLRRFIENDEPLN